jgi:aromatic ring-opening dioxygenase catalytic subunit (LigB family)
MPGHVRLPTLFIPHGGGPCFFMDVPPGLPPTLWDAMAAYLRSIPAALPCKPKAALVISGHWEQARPTVLAAARHKLLFDYYGFPENTYRLKYPAPGSPELAARVRDLLSGAGIASDVERERGLDHGVFVPFKLIFPDADVPLVQLSLQQGLDAATHLAIGAALAPLRDEGVLIVGSGMSYHNLRLFYSFSPDAVEAATRFDAWLERTVQASPGERAAQLLRWHEAPFARECHPHSEHLLPLMVAAGAAQEDLGRTVYREPLLGKPVAGFQFGR